MPLTAKIREASPAQDAGEKAFLARPAASALRWCPDQDRAERRISIVACDT
jgi:hypothetical protein